MPTFPVRLLPSSCCSGQSPEGSDRTLQGQKQLSVGIRPSKVTGRVTDKSERGSQGKTSLASDFRELIKNTTDWHWVKFE